ncbi:hypothetical protein PROFUN_01192 [Planoprotostelium fungivorum]|uniref:Short-chain dehydrogenase/reductase SDR n=1 Tax=Planoprotostelium fungivorum TaxID=1890364 RepID=A0A2P6NCM4_9EUKA|nr:hypothetical protein PROFUN_01192 [Planoprotostelium fungivorum]
MSEQSRVFVTGANTGLGLEVVKALYTSATPYEIFLGSRSLEKAEEAIKTVKALSSDSRSNITPVQVDVSSDDSISQAFDAISSKTGHLDVLINNAGASFDQALVEGKISVRECFNQAWDTNVTGTHILTHTFVPLLLKSSTPRLIFVTSGLSSLTEAANFSHPRSVPPPAGWPKSGPSFTAYRSSKTGLNMVALEWTKTLKNDGVKVFTISPGLLATGLGGNPEALKKMGALDPSIGGHFIKDVVEGKRDDDTSKVIRKDMVQPF